MWVSTISEQAPWHPSSSYLISFSLTCTTCILKVKLALQHALGMSESDRVDRMRRWWVSSFIFSILSAVSGSPQSMVTTVEIVHLLLRIDNNYCYFYSCEKWSTESIFRYYFFLSLSLYIYIIYVHIYQSLSLFTYLFIRHCLPLIVLFSSLVEILLFFLVFYLPLRNLEFSTRLTTLNWAKVGMI